MILTNIFQSTLPARGATTARQHPDSRMAISIHAPRTGSDNSIRTENIQTALHFNPRSPHGERRGCPTVCCDRKKHFNPRSPHGERLSFFDFTRVALYISIHAPRTGSDGNSYCQIPEYANFNPRSPHGERHCESCNQPCLTTFQSTLPARGATFAVPKNVRRSKFQSTLPARGATCIAEWRITHVAHFNPRSPHGERLRQAVGYIRRQISIHAPRTGSDAKGQVYPNRQAYFNPRSPHGERLDGTIATATADVFQSTLPARGATFYICQGLFNYPISIHAPRTGSDAIAPEQAQAPELISIHAPRTGSDRAR